MEGKHFQDDAKHVALHPIVKPVATLCPTSEGAQDRAMWKKEVKAEYDIEEWSERDMLHEGLRCLKCADAPCAKSCPCHIDIKGMNWALSKKNYYAAAKHAYSENPLALSCGYLCAGFDLCRGGCNLSAVHDGPVGIPALQRFACEQFGRMKIPQIRAPGLPPVSELPGFYNNPIALLGGGPASLSCAAYLSRLGYQNITVFEKEAYLGGTLAREIPEFRIPYAALQQDIDQCLALGGVNVRTNSPVTGSLEDLQGEFPWVFLGTGLPDPITLPIFQDTGYENLQTAKEFLPLVAHAMKPLTLPQSALPSLKGHCVVLGGGDVAFNTAAAALKCGAEHVTLVYRENWPQIPASWEEIMVGLKEKIDFVANAVPTALVGEGNRVSGVRCKFSNWDNKHVVFADGQEALIKADHVLVAFGARSGTPLGSLELNSRGVLDVDQKSNSVKGLSGVWAGGDIVGHHTVVDAVNDGKTAAWFMHVAMMAAAGEAAPANPTLPRFYTEVDKVDIGVDILGIHFPNPFGLSSATPVTSIGMIKRAFDVGFGFAVTKTAVLDKDLPLNVSPRIVRSTPGTNYGPEQGGFLNIENVTEKTMKYWVEGVKNLKKEYPTQVVIFSIMAQYNKEDWQTIAKMAETSGADALELNVSCPHVGKKGMGSAAGQNPDAVQEISSWVKEAVKIPVFTKLTPNVTDIAKTAEAAVLGGADGVSAINTVSGLVHIRRDGSAWPNVGREKKTAYGGMSGNIIRPIGLRAVTAIRGQESTKNTVVLGIGGIDSADSAIQFLLGGANVVQMTSSIQNQDYSIVDEMIEGLKCHLYYNARRDLAPLESQYLKSPVAGAVPSEPLPTVASEVGKAAKQIHLLPELDGGAQVKAEVDQDACLRCGKCYMSCNDTGYQAMEFDPETHLPSVTDKCMGCGLCGSVCPAACITYVLKTAPHIVDRGLE